MKQIIELAAKYGLTYTFWAWLEDNNPWKYTWVATLIENRMNSISMRKFGKNVFSRPD